ncbi:DNA mismatch repair protein [Datura stramonium]|uniref:DNA mismatch repair protein n=1 Tax=Datura stramonium TaxID=4076 RepID=A0ABS8VFX0_DATST|nr:DNA mismatch repair protein [Datura stramonium]
MYQQVLRRFAHFYAIQLSEPASLPELIMLALKEEGTDPEGNESNELRGKIAEMNTELLKQKAEMLEEYFSIYIDSNGNMSRLPVILDQYTPDIDRIPEFILCLGNDVSSLLFPCLLSYSLDFIDGVESLKRKVKGVEVGTAGNSFLGVTRAVVNLKLIEFSGAFGKILRDSSRKGENLKKVSRPREQFLILDGESSAQNNGKSKRASAFRKGQTLPKTSQDNLKEESDVTSSTFMLSFSGKECFYRSYSISRKNFLKHSKRNRFSEGVLKEKLDLIVEDLWDIVNVPSVGFDEYFMNKWVKYGPEKSKVFVTTKFG